MPEDIVIKINIKSRKTIQSPIGTIYQDEFEKIEKVLDQLDKGWSDINFKTLRYHTITQVPYKCGGKFQMHWGDRNMFYHGYDILFRFKGEPKVPERETKPNRKYGRV